MSRASKITLAVSSLVSVATIGGVYYMAELEKEVSTLKKTYNSLI